MAPFAPPFTLDGSCTVLPVIHLAADGMTWDADVASLDGAMVAHIRYDRFLTVSHSGIDVDNFTPPLAALE